MQIAQRDSCLILNRIITDMGDGNLIWRLAVPHWPFRMDVANLAWIDLQ